jgi:anti-sigma regulatory factor (Ser/Thr protein kinase)
VTPAPDQLRLRIASDPAQVSEARRAVEAFAGACGMPQAAVSDIGLCVNEALANIIRHAYGEQPDQPIEITALLADDHLRIELRDWGSGIDPRSLPQPRYNPLTPGGLGLICLEQMMDRVEYVPQEKGMLLIMTKRAG